MVSMLARLEEQLGGRRSATVIFENDSADDTRARLLAWAQMQRASGVHLLLARRVRGPRTVRLAGRWGCCSSGKEPMPETAPSN